MSSPNCAEVRGHAGCKGHSGQGMSVRIKSQKCEVWSCCRSGVMLDMAYQIGQMGVFFFFFWGGGGGDLNGLCFDDELGRSDWRWWVGVMG